MRYRRSLCCDGKLLFGILFSGLCNRVLKLPSGFLSSGYRLFQLLAMSRRVLLRHNGSDCSEWGMYIRLILDRFFNHLFKLFSRNIFVI